MLAMLSRVHAQQVTAIILNGCARMHQKWTLERPQEANTRIDTADPLQARLNDGR